MMRSKKIPLTQGKFAIVDAEDFERVNQFKWHLAHDGCKRVEYARRKGPRNSIGKRKNYLMHRSILGAPKGKFVDHINHNGLDNRKTNLRLASNQQNQFNSRRQVNNKTGFKGVKNSRWSKNPFIAQIRFNNKSIHLGGFKTAEEAAKAYDKAAKKYQGEYAWLNFP